jgi:hypothetical protein
MEAGLQLLCHKKKSIKQAICSAGYFKSPTKLHTGAKKKAPNLEPFYICCK